MNVLSTDQVPADWDSGSNELPSIEYTVEINIFLFIKVTLFPDCLCKMYNLYFTNYLTVYKNNNKWVLSTGIVPLKLCTR